MGLHLQANLLADSDNAKDTIVNTWNITTPGGHEPTPATAAAAVSALHGFYRSVPAGQANGLCHYLSPWLKTTNGLVIKAYDNTGKLGPPTGDPKRMPLLGSPIATEVESFPELGLQPFPSHVACVLTLEGQDWDDQPVEVAGNPPTRPRSSRRGRVYLGPLAMIAADANGTTDCAPVNAFRALVFAAFAKFRDDIAAIDPTWKPAVWSRSEGAMWAIESISMDDRLDVVQRRKRYGSTRTRVLV